MTTPRRIQLRRTKGWRLHDISPDAIVVTRSSKWGNPWRVDFAAVVGPGMDHVAYLTPETARAMAVEIYRAWLIAAHLAPSWKTLSCRRSWILGHLTGLAGHDLACWCPLGQPCHADVLLDIANRDGGAL
ncbi:hypothetical protein DSM43518_04808 [Mycobacterium marinum]|uniref:DUF4326 domain-containing protein n=1 Tax=Mycobacterium marinum TaxID=1781 RepID=UPI000CD98377|nr:DUF4326 domain-containing protein [Mycobacterium marinum]AXN51266.1 hypothetical protein CCUG20998_03870 [Mycobacterium marinum]RFZ02821.1 hypothetical protein DSM43518_04808 [Mycobacterium marinum]RFZ26012.1 hypothetical protein DSM43519_01326 [Mycobacterium marinum]RFZ28891.1 hypothetical protein DSM44344_01158 [Mycobacterium marinum]WOR03272.1 DUF4326 domain-containing protein [Mycobacterium marinum]